MATRDELKEALAQVRLAATTNARAVEALANVIDDVVLPDDTLAIYADIKKSFGSTFVPRFFQIQAMRPNFLRSLWLAVKSVLLEGRLDRATKELMFVAVSKATGCVYCEAAHAAFSITCEPNGDDLIAVVRRDHSRIKDPIRRELVDLSRTVGEDPRADNRRHIEVLRGLGLDHDEVLEALRMCSLAIYANSLADSFKIAVDSEFTQLLDMSAGMAAGDDLGA